MVQTETAPGGAEEWTCTQCSRRLMIRWTPEFDKLVLDRGDEHAPHAGGKGGVGFGRVSVEPAPAGPTDRDHDWLAGLGIAWQQRPAS